MHPDSARGVAFLESGELLIEVLVTVAILGIGVVGVMAALGSSVRLSAVSRAGSQADQLLVRYAENLVAVAYEPCTSGSAPYAATGVKAIPGADLPSGASVGTFGAVAATDRAFEVGIESVSYWNGDSPTATFSATCPANDLGAQQLTLLVRSGDGTAARRLTIIKRVL